MRKLMLMKLRMRDSDDSIFVKDAKAFEDRMTLLNMTHNTFELLSIMQEEIEEYNKKSDKRISYYQYIQKQLKVIDTYINTVEHLGAQMCSGLSGIEKVNDIKTWDDVFETTPIHDGKARLRLHVKYPYFEALANLFKPLELYETPYDFIYELTESKFLAYDTDIDIFIKNKATLKKIEKEALLIGAALYARVSPYLIDSKALVKIGLGEVILASPKNRSAESLDNIDKYLKTNSSRFFQNVDIELYKEKERVDGSIIKENIFGVEQDSQIIKCNPLYMNRLLRELCNLPESNYDDYFEIDKNIVKIETPLKQVEVM